MLRTPLNLALVAATILAAGAAQANDAFAARALTAPHGEGRWINRRLTLRHAGQDAPKGTVAAARHEDGFLARMATEPKERGRWLDRRLTFRHRGQDAPKA